METWYAWRPVRLYDGKWTWLKTVEVRDYMDFSVPVWAYSNLWTNKVYYPL